MQEEELAAYRSDETLIRQSPWFLKIIKFLLVIFLAYQFSDFNFSKPLYEVKTNYLHWSSILPAVTVCQVPSNKEAKSNLEQFLNNLEWPKLQYCWKCSNESTFPVNEYRRIVVERVKRCPDLFEECKWNGLKLDCCSTFKHLPTKRGVCFSLNSEITGSRFQLEVSHYSKQGELSLSTLRDVKIYLHDPKDVLFTDSLRLKVRAGEKLDVLYKVKNGVSDESARFLSLQSRGCILPGELPEYPVYSQTLCQLRCLANAQANICSCTHHLLPNLGYVPDCDLSGLKCLDKNFGKQIEKKTLRKCNCLPSCTDMEIKLVWSNISRISSNKRQVDIILATPPTEKVVLKGRYQLIDALGKYTKDIKDGRIVFPVRVTKDRIVIGDQNLENRYKRSEATAETPVHFKIPLGGKEEFIELTRNPSMFAPGAILEFRTNDSTFPDELSNIKTSMIPDHQSIYFGVVKDIEDSSVALSTYNGLCGFIRTKRHTYLIEPTKNYLPNQKMPHVLYEYSHKDKINVGKCAVTQANSHLLQKKRSKSRQRLAQYNKNVDTNKNNYSQNLPLNLETLLVVDKAMIENHLPMSELENYLFTVLNMVQSLFHDLTLKPINIEIVRTVYLLDDSEKINQENQKPAVERLRSFSEWQNLINPRSEYHPNHHDLAVLLTGYDICDIKHDCHYLGIAEQNGICHPKRQATICRDNGLILAYTLAHEIAHTLGIEHDTGMGNSCDPKMSDGSSSIMDPIISFISRVWTKCSQESLAASIEQGCLSCLVDEPSTMFAHNIDMLPGVIYGGDFQCKSLYNQNAKSCNNEGDCESLKCQFDGTSCSNTGLLLVPGTSCGQNKWCYDRECVDVGNRPGCIHGGWSTWSEWSQCSRTCGSGVSVSKRDCNNPTPRYGGKMCSGQRKRHKICSTEPCPIDGISFRDVQCAEYNDWIFPEDEKTHIWKGFFINSGNPCALTCKNENNVVVTLTPKVIDGTTCYRGIRDVCIDGVCSFIPCDLQLDSNSVEDSCGICHGNGTGCKILQGTKIIKGPSSILTSVPVGSRNIKVNALSPMNSNIFVKTMDNKRLLNDRGKFGMFWVPGSVAWLGMSKPNHELLEIPGPINEPINIWIKNASSNGHQTMAYSIGLPSEPRDGIYTWDYIDWLPCTSQCGAGTQESIPKCVELTSGHVEDVYCKHLGKPRVKRRTCDAGPCYTRWLIGEWHECGPCPSSEAKRFRLVRCVKTVEGLEEGTAFVSNEECHGSRPISSECCQCLKHQARHWPDYHSQISSRSENNSHLNNYKIRGKRSTTTPEKKVTLMQLESENEESMFKQFKENQNKHSPLVYIPSFFGGRFNFTIPLKKREVLPEENIGNMQDSLKNEINNGNSLSMLEGNLIFHSSFLPPITEGPFINSVQSSLKMGNFTNPLELNPENDYFEDKNYSKYLMASNINSQTTQIPLNFSDENILKILSNNIALHKLQKQHDRKLIDNQRSPIFPNEKILFGNSFDRKNIDFLNSVGNELYNALEMQEYLQSLLNTSHYKNNIQKFTNVTSSNPEQLLLKRYKLKLPSLDMKSVISGKNEDLNNYYLKKALQQYLNLKHSNDSNYKSNDVMRNRSTAFLIGHPLNIDRKVNRLSELLNNVFKTQAIPYIKDQTNKSLGHGIFNTLELVDKQSRKKQMPRIYINKENEIYQTRFNNLDDNENKNPKEDKNGSSLINKIISKLQSLSYENKITIYNDLIYITEYLKALLDSDALNNISSLNYIETENKNVLTNLKNNGVVHADPFKTIETNQICSQNFNNTPPLSHDNFESLLLTSRHNALQNKERNNYLCNKLHYNALENVPNQCYSSLWKRKIPYNYHDIYLMNDLYDDSSVPLKTNERNNEYLHKNHEDSQHQVGKRYSANLVGPLKFIYPIPKERECTTTEKPRDNIQKSLCKDKRNVLQKLSYPFINSYSFPQKKSSINTDYIPMQVVPKLAAIKIKNSSNDSKNYYTPIFSFNSKAKGYLTSQQISSKHQKSVSCRGSCSTSEYGCTNTTFRSFQTSTTSQYNKTDIFYCPPKFDDPYDTNNLKCMNNLLYELQKELQLARHRQCTAGCYYVYKDETTIPTNCTNN